MIRYASAAVWALLAATTLGADLDGLAPDALGISANTASTQARIIHEGFALRGKLAKQVAYREVGKGREQERKLWTITRKSMAVAMV